ncbi:MAG TPA: Verru_Chthon cassette protein D [Verrucomicrobiales bacterium]|jgi:uncharacterized protein (TIGR02596 family)|nr:Verru_Chthon cassette protein D [Verrucomicrobiales bacterium]
MKPLLSLPRYSRRRAFTLVEILIVLAIIAMLLFFTVPGLKDVLKGSKLTGTADQIIQDIGLARQTAIKESVPVEVRFYKYRNPDARNEERFSAYQCFRLLQDRNNPSDYTADRIPVPLFEKVKFIPQGVVLVEAKEWSPLVMDEKMHNDRERVRGLVPAEKDTEAKYYSFIINPEGETNLDRTGAKQWYITLVTETEYQKAPDPMAIKPNDFITLQIDPFTSNVRRYQPN